MMFKLENSRTQNYDIGRYRGRWGDLGNGKYNNPVLAGDFSDPDIIRVGEDYFLICSTMQLSPGLTVLHSRDLVNWSIINNAVRDLTQISQNYNWNKMNGYSRCIWAPCITYNKKNSTFYIHFGTPDDGFFMVKTRDPFGEWSDVYEVKKADGSRFGFGWDDCSVLWDEDQAYSVATNFADNYKGYLFKLSDDGTTVLDDGVLIHAPHNEYAPLEYGPEANKLFKKDGKYYFFHNGCHTVEGATVRMAFIMRSDCIYGIHPDGTPGTFDNPGRYEHIKEPIVQGFREPCQGNIVDAITPQGVKWYFFTHHGSTDKDGRPCSLLPLEWQNGWPIVKYGEVEGRMIWENIEKPFPDSKKIIPQTSDDFDSAKLGHQWMWSFQPRADMYSLTERPGYLRLYAYKPLVEDKIETAGNTLLERNYRYNENVATAKFDISGMAEGQNAGLLHAAGRFHYGICVSVENGRRYIKIVSNDSRETITEFDASVKTVWFKSTWDFDFVNSFYYSFDGTNYMPAKDNIQLRGNDYRGDYIGFYNYNNISESGYVDIDYIKVESN